MTQYHRGPTQGEIRFGYGCTHYMQFTREQCYKNGRAKKWLIYDGLRYYKS